MGYVLIVMFAAFPSTHNVHPFVAMQRFETEAACVEAQQFVVGNHPGHITKCIKDGKDDGAKQAKPQQFGLGELGR